MPNSFASLNVCPVLERMPVFFIHKENEFVLSEYRH